MIIQTKLNVVFNPYNCALNKVIVSVGMFALDRPTTFECKWLENVTHLQHHPPFASSFFKIVYTKLLYMHVYTSCQKNAAHVA